ncbi:MAG: hypothetical protein JWL84_3560 [Rhodospirillales bacterium]|jgi:hypothetical protein|nr:hypothetical protein [Rhodospirillales bacterium]
MSTANTAPNAEIVTELGNALVRWRELMNERAIKDPGLCKPFEIGQRLLEQGGEDLMIDVFYDIDDQFSDQDMASLDCAWTGIGGWVA